MFDRIIKTTITLAVAIALCASCIVRAHAGESYGHSPKPPTTPSTSIGVGSTSGAGASSDQSQTQGQGQAQNAKGGKASATGGNGGSGGTGGTGGSASTGAINASSGPSTSSSSSGASSAKTGASTSSSFQNASTGASTSQGGAVVTDTNNSGNFNYREAANVVQPATMIISGCQVQGQAGGANTRAAGMLGIGFTPASCYDYIQAQAYLAIGAVQAACEVLNHTKAAQRAVKNGATLPACLPPAPPVAVVTPSAPVYTQQQVAEIVRKAVSK